MRILSGRYKGHKLFDFSKKNSVRPMTQRVKKSVFDTIRPYLKDARVLDLFSGSGQISLEALSQGAKMCHAVEQNKQCCRWILRNAQKLKIEKEIVLHQEEVFHFLKKQQDLQSFDIIFADPPFQKKYGMSIIQHLSLSSVCRPDTLVILEAGSQESIPEDSSFVLKNKKSFGDKDVYFLNIVK